MTKDYKDYKIKKTLSLSSTILYSTTLLYLLCTYSEGQPTMSIKKIKKGQPHCIRLDEDEQKAVDNYMTENQLENVSQAMRYIVRQWMVYTGRDIEQKMRDDWEWQKHNR